MPETSIVAGREQERYYPYTGMFYANRHSFWEAGQNSFDLPPAQNQDAFLQLSNVEPVLQGVLQRRRGYQFFASLSPGQGPSAPTSAVNFGTPSNPWSNPTNIFAQDGAVASATVSNVLGNTAQLQATGFNFNVPLTATILTVSISVVCNQSSGGLHPPALLTFLIVGGSEVASLPSIEPPANGAAMTAQTISFPDRSLA